MGFKHVVPQVIKRIYDQENPFKLYGHSQSRSFCYIDDAASCFDLIMNSDECSGLVVNLGTNTETKIEELVESMFDVCNYHPEVEFADPVAGSVARRCPDISLVSSLTGYLPKVSLEEGLTNSCEWYLNYYSQS